MDEILLKEKVSATNHEAPKFLDSDYDTNNLYQFDKMSLEETEENLDWSKRAFECKKKNSYGIENRNDMRCMHNNEVNNIAECNLLHGIINPPKGNKFLNNNYYPILHGCMNTRKLKAKFKNFFILLDIRCSSWIIMVKS